MPIYENAGYKAGFNYRGSASIIGIKIAQVYIFIIFSILGTDVHVNARPQSR